MSDDFRHDATSDRELRLADGRRMQWSEFGAPDGTPMLSCHGGLLCRSSRSTAPSSRLLTNMRRSLRTNRSL
jgi:hypothetical protein